MRFIHALLAVLLTQIAVPAGLLSGGCVLSLTLDESIPLLVLIKAALGLTVWCWFISVPVSLIVGLPLVLRSLYKNKLTLLSALIINLIVSICAIAPLYILMKQLMFWIYIAIPICFFGTLVLWVYFKNYVLFIRPISMVIVIFIIILLPLALSKLTPLSADESESQTYRTLDRTMYERIEQDRGSSK